MWNARFHAVDIAWFFNCDFDSCTHWFSRIVIDLSQFQNKPLWHHTKFWQKICVRHVVATMVNQDDAVSASISNAIRCPLGDMSSMCLLIIGIGGFKRHDALGKNWQILKITLIFHGFTCCYCHHHAAANRPYVSFVSIDNFASAGVFLSNYPNRRML